MQQNDKSVQRQRDPPPLHGLHPLPYTTALSHSRSRTDRTIPTFQVRVLTLSSPLSLWRERSLRPAASHQTLTWASPSPASSCSDALFSAMKCPQWSVKSNFRVTKWFVAFAACQVNLRKDMPARRQYFFGLLVCYQIQNFAQKTLW